MKNQSILIAFWNYYLLKHAIKMLLTAYIWDHETHDQEIWLMSFSYFKVKVISIAFETCETGGK